MKLAGITALIVVFIGLGILRLTKDQPDNEQSLEQHIANQQPSQEYTNIDEATTTGRYIPIESLESANPEGNKTVYFFNASWCPTCQVAKKAFSEQANIIPDGLTIVDADYDEHKELRKKYGVTTQHTFVQIDNEGNLLKKWSGSFVPAQIIKEVV